jgi:hypothetical protein
MPICGYYIFHLNSTVRLKLKRYATIAVNTNPKMQKIIALL